MPITIESFGLTEEQKQKLVVVTPDNLTDENFIKDGLVTPGYWLVDRRPSGRVIKELLCAGDFAKQETLVEEQVQIQPLVEVPVVEELVETQVVEKLIEPVVSEPLVEAPATSQESTKVDTLTEGTNPVNEGELKAPAKRGRKKQQ